MNSPDDWFSRAMDKEKVARLLVDDKKSCREAIIAAGTAVEFALKGVIMRRERFNQWPDRFERRDLHVHDLQALFDTAGLDHDGLPASLRAKLRVVMGWGRSLDYESDRVPRRVARDMVEATFGEDGVVPWLKTL